MDSKDPIVITKHGTSYDEKRDIQEMYPICICPECVSGDTEVVSGGLSVIDGIRPGIDIGKRTESFIRNYYYVNYICNTCSCEWTKIYEDKKKKSTILSDKIHASSYLIIFILLTVLAIVSLICSLGVAYDYPVDDAPWYLVLWVGSSTVFFFIIFAVCAIISFADV